MQFRLQVHQSQRTFRPEIGPSGYTWIRYIYIFIYQHRDPSTEVSLRANLREEKGNTQFGLNGYIYGYNFIFIYTYLYTYLSIYIHIYISAYPCAKKGKRNLDNRCIVWTVSLLIHRVRGGRSSCGRFWSCTCRVVCCVVLFLLCVSVCDLFLFLQC